VILRCLPQVFCEVIRDRQVQERLSAKQRQHEASWLKRIEALGRPRDDAGGGFECHLRRELVVVAMIALEAVVAGEIALKRGQNRDPKLIAALADIAEIVFEFAALSVAVVDHEPMLGQGGERLALLLILGDRAAVNPLEQIRDVARDNDLRVGEGVHQEHVAAVPYLLEGNTDVEHRGSHRLSLPRRSEKSGWGNLERPRADAGHRGSEIATGIPAIASLSKESVHSPQG